MQFRRPSRAEVGINIAPLVDVVFLLVIFFAVSTSFLETAGLELELPRSSSTADREVEDIRVELAADGTVALDGETVDLKTLASRLREVLGRSERKSVTLSADTHTPHGQVVEVMDVVRGAGAQSLTVAAQAASPQ